MTNTDIKIETNVETDDGKIDMSHAIIELLRPIYERYGKDRYDNIKDFVDEGFWLQGGRIDIGFPNWLKVRMLEPDTTDAAEIPELVDESSHEIFKPDEEE